MASIIHLSCWYLAVVGWALLALKRYVTQNQTWKTEMATALNNTLNKHINTVLNHYIKLCHDCIKNLNLVAMKRSDRALCNTAIHTFLRY